MLDRLDAADKLEEPLPFGRFALPWLILVGAAGSVLFLAGMPLIGTLLITSFLALPSAWVFGTRRAARKEYGEAIGRLGVVESESHD